MKANKRKEKLILTPEADLVASRIEEMRDYYAAQLEKHANTEKVVFDATGIEVIDSLGVNLIIGLYRQANADGKSFEVVNAGAKFMKVATFFRFPTLFTVTAGENAK